MRDFITLLKRYGSMWGSIAGGILLCLVNSIAQLALPSQLEKLVDGGILLEDSLFIRQIGIRMLAMCLLLGLSGYAGAVLMKVAGERFACRLRVQVYGRIQQLSTLQNRDFGSGTLITRVMTDVAAVSGFTGECLQLIGEPVFLLIGGIIMIMGFFPPLGLVFALFALGELLIMLLFIRMTASGFRSVQEKTDRLNRRLSQSLKRLRLIKLLLAQKRERGAFEKENQTFFEESYRLGRICAVFNPLMMLMMNVTVAGILAFSGRGVGDNRIMIGQVMAVVSYAEQILLSIIVSGKLFQTASRMIPSAGRILEVLDTEPAMVPGETELEEKASSFSARSLSFAYAENKKVLEEISFCLEKGSRTAVTGGVACGKTTLADVLGRIYPTPAGTVFLGDTDILELTEVSLRKQISLVSKETAILSGTVMDNLVSRRDWVKEEMAIKAAEAACIKKVIDALPAGFDTMLSGGGSVLSSGEKQRLVLARGLAAEPAVLILDEGMLALDYRTEEEIFSNIRRAYPDLILLYFTQRAPSTLRADHILVLKDGRVSGAGTAAALLKDCPDYKALFYEREERSPAV